MANQPLRLSQDTLAKFDRSLDTEPGPAGSPRRRLGSISTRRSSKDHSHRQLTLPSLTNSHISISKRLSFKGWHHGGRVSFSGLCLHEPVQEVHVENTYRTDPDTGGHFSPTRTQRILQATLNTYLEDVSYNADSCVQLTRMLADLVLSQMKDVNPPRYKLVCQVYVGQRNDQGLTMASRSLLNTNTDNYASAAFKNHSLFAVAVVHGLYYE